MMGTLVVAVFLAASMLTTMALALRRANREYLAERLLAMKPPLPGESSSGEGRVSGDKGSGVRRFGKCLKAVERLSPRLPFPIDRRELEKAGLELAPGEFQAARLLLLAAMQLFILSTGGLPLACLCAVPAALLSWRLPLMLVKKRQARRQELISDALPDVLDMLTLLLLTGLGLKAALPRAVACSHGPLRDEFERIFLSMELGMPRQQALALLEERNASDDLKRFVRAVQRAERFGAPLSSSMEHLASEMRHRQKSRLREKAHKAPIKILFPLVFLILPSFLLLTVGGMVLGEGFG